MFRRMISNNSKGPQEMFTTNTWRGVDCIAYLPHTLFTHHNFSDKSWIDQNFSKTRLVSVVSCWQQFSGQFHIIIISITNHNQPGQCSIRMDIDNFVPLVFVWFVVDVRHNLPLYRSTKNAHINKDQQSCMYTQCTDKSDYIDDTFMVRASERGKMWQYAFLLLNHHHSSL